MVFNMPVLSDLYIHLQHGKKKNSAPLSPAVQEKKSQHPTPKLLPVAMNTAVSVKHKNINNATDYNTSYSLND